MTTVDWRALLDAKRKQLKAEVDTPWRIRTRTIKCQGCGAEVNVDQLACPLCGAELR
jgi:rRNA maturation endonuclease Nob1